MDEVSISFDMTSGFAVENKGTKSVKISTTGNEKCNFTVVLCVIADGAKRNPLVIFKRKTIPKETFSKGIVVNVNPKGWMTSDMFGFWLENVWRKRKNALFCSKSLLIYDSARSHITDEVKKLVRKYSEIAVIPGGLTSKLQPLDLSVNKSFKDKMRAKWDQWMIKGYHSYTKSGSMKRASYAEVCKWIVESWKEVTVDCVKNGFRKAMICYYLTDDITDLESNESTSGDDSTEEELEPQTLPENFMDIFENFKFESDED